MILFDRESVKGRSGTCHGFCERVKFPIQTTSHARLDATNRKKTRVELVGNPCFAVNKTFKSYIVRSRFGAGIVRGLNIP